MVILLDAPSKIGRVTIAEKAVSEHPAWTHLALEVVEKASPDGAEEAFHLQLIKRCIDELAQTGMHLLLTLPSDSPRLAHLTHALKPACVTVHLGTERQSDADHMINTKTMSAREAVALLGSLMDEAASA